MSAQSEQLKVRSMAFAADANLCKIAWHRSSKLQNQRSNQMIK